MSASRPVLESENCTSEFLETLRGSSRLVGRILRGTTAMMIAHGDGNWHVDFEHFLPQFDDGELTDVISMVMSRRFWTEQVCFLSDEGLRSCVRALDRMSGLPESC